MSADLVLGAVAALAIGGTVWLEWRFDRRETRLRRMLGSCRTALAACEVERDQMRRQFNAQSVELARYRGGFAPSQRLTRVYTGVPEPSEPSEE